MENLQNQQVEIVNDELEEKSFKDEILDHSIDLICSEKGQGNHCWEVYMMKKKEKVS